MEGKVPSAPQCAILLTINMFVLFFYFFRLSEQMF